MKFLIFAVVLACLAITEGAYQPPGKFDLSPDDLDALCKVVDPNQTKKPSKCMYMKWVACPKGEGDAKKPCGWYEQTLCEDQKREPKNRQTREAVFPELENAEPAFLSWPDSIY